MSIKKINIIVEDESIKSAARGYRRPYRQAQGQAITRTMKRGLPFKRSRDPWKIIAAGLLGTYRESLRFLEEFWQRSTRESIRVEDFDIFNLDNMDNIEKLFFKIMTPSAMVDRRGTVLPQFKMDPGFVKFYNSYRNQKIGPAAYRSQQQSLAKSFKKDLIEKGFEEELFGDQMERRLYHASGHKDKKARAEVLFSPFYNSKYPTIKTFNDFIRHFKSDKRFQFLVQALYILKRAKSTQNNYDNYLGNAWTTFFVVVGIALPKFGTRSIWALILHEIGLFLSEEALRYAIIDDEGSLFKAVIEDYRTTNRKLTDVCDSIDKMIPDYKKCVESKKDCPEIRNKINKKITDIEQTVKQHFSFVFSELEKANRLSNFRGANIKDTIINTQMSSNVILPEVPKSSGDLKQWSNKSRYRISKISEMTKALKSGYLSKIIEQLETSEKEAAGEKWMKDFKQLMSELTKDGSLVKEQTGEIDQIENLFRKYPKDNDESKIEKYYLKAAFAQNFKQNRQNVVRKEINRQRELMRKKASKFVGTKLAVSQGLTDEAVTEHKRAVSLFFDQVVDEFYLDISQDAQKGMQDQLRFPQIFIKIKGDNNLYTFYGTDGKDIYESTFIEVFKGFAATGKISSSMSQRQFIARIRKYIQSQIKLKNDENFEVYKKTIRGVIRDFTTKANGIRQKYPNYIINNNKNFDLTELANKFKYYVEVYSTLPSFIINSIDGSNIQNLATALIIGEALFRKKSNRVKDYTPGSVPPYRLKNIRENIKDDYLSRTDLLNMIKEIMCSPEYFIAEDKNKRKGKTKKSGKRVSVYGFSNAAGLFGNTTGGGAGQAGPAGSPDGGNTGTDKDIQNDQGNDQGEKPFVTVQYKEDPEEPGKPSTGAEPGSTETSDNDMTGPNAGEITKNNKTVNQKQKTNRARIKKPVRNQNKTKSASKIFMRSKITNKSNVQEEDTLNDKYQKIRGTKVTITFKDPSGNQKKVFLQYNGVLKREDKTKIKLAKTLEELPGAVYDENSQNIVINQAQMEFAK